MANSSPETVLCITSYEKGQEFVRECKRRGWRVLFLTTTGLEQAHWPHESIDELFYMPDLSRLDDVIHGVSYLARTRIIDRIVALRLGIAPRNQAHGAFDVLDIGLGQHVRRAQQNSQPIRAASSRRSNSHLAYKLSVQTIHRALPT